MSPARIVVFWAPLALMWLMMSVEGPMIAAVIARLPEPEANLAAFQLTFALALVVESPVIMLLTAGTALATSTAQSRRLLHFTAALAVALTIIHLALALTPLYDVVVGRVMAAPEELIEPSRVAFLLMAAWSGAIAFRRLWQGVLIRYGRTRRVTVITVIRLLATAASLWVGLRWASLAGASVGGLALSIAVTVAAGAAYVLVRRVLRHDVPATGARPIPWSDLVSFYTPLAATSFIVLGGGAILTLGLGRSPDALTALAVWPVIVGLMFLVRSGGYAYQEAVVALIERPGAQMALRRVAVGLGLALAAVMAVFALTELGRLWMTAVAGLSPELAAAAVPPLAWLIPAPALTVAVSWHRGRLVHAGATPDVTRAVTVNVIVLAGVMTAGLMLLGSGAEGAVIAAAATTASLVAETLVLARATRASDADRAQRRVVPADGEPADRKPAAAPRA